jgi:hypothetical protein
MGFSLIKFKTMIQTKNVILCIARNQKFGKLKMKVTEAIPDGIGGNIYTIEDTIIESDGSEIIIKPIKTVTYSKAQIDETDAYIEANFSDMLVGLAKTEKEQKKIQIGLMLDTKTNLLENGKTTWGQTPNDWEFTPDN